MPRPRSFRSPAPWSTMSGELPFPKHDPEQINLSTVTPHFRAVQTEGNFASWRSQRGRGWWRVPEESEAPPPSIVREGVGRTWTQQVGGPMSCHSCQHKKPPNLPRILMPLFEPNWRQFPGSKISRDWENAAGHCSSAPCFTLWNGRRRVRRVTWVRGAGGGQAGKSLGVDKAQPGWTHTSSPCRRAGELTVNVTAHGGGIWAARS